MAQTKEESKLVIAKSNAVLYSGLWDFRENWSPDWIAQLRAEYGLSQRDLAERIGRDHTYVSHIEAGRRIPSPEVLRTIASVFVDLSEEADDGEEEQEE